MKPLKVLAAALGAAVLGLALGMFIAGPGVLLRTDLGQALFARFVPPKYPAPGGAAQPGDAVRPFTVHGFDGRPRSLPTPARCSTTTAS